MKLKQGISALYKKVCTSMPPDVEQAVRKAAEGASDKTGRDSLFNILDTAADSRQQKKPLCVDSGVPVFFVSIPSGVEHQPIRDTIIEATREATSKVPLAPNAVDILTGENSGDNSGEGFPVIYLDESTDSKLKIELMLLGAGTESLGGTFPISGETIRNGAAMDAIKAIVADSVDRAHGKGCPPYIIGIGVAALRDRAAWLSKQQLRRKLEDKPESEALADFEAELAMELNEKAGRTIVLGIKAGTHHHHPEACFVDISFMCWNTRRGTLVW